MFCLRGQSCGERRIVLKHKYMKPFLLKLMVCCVVTGAYGHDTTQVQTKKLIWTPLPIIMYSPYTGLGYGALANLNFSLGDTANTRVSNAQALVLFTTRHQTSAQVNHQIFFEQERLIWQGKLQYLDWPEYTYGQGSRTSDEPPVKELVEYKAVELEERLLWKMSPGNFLGVQYRFYTSWDLQSDQPDSLSYFKQYAVGNDRYTASGLGVHYVLDTRDNVQNAYKGTYLELAVNPYPKVFGSTHQWTNLRVDYRYYYSFKGKRGNLIATRLFGEQAIGNVPYLVEPMSGRYFTTRGFVQGRYRGKTYLCAEVEYRRLVWRRFGYVLFSNIHTISEPNGSIQYVNPAAGAGIRFMLNTANRINIRMDYARGLNDNGGLYFQITEVF